MELTDKQKKLLNETPSEIKAISLTELLHEMDIKKERLEGTIVALLSHIYKENDVQIIQYLAMMDTMDKEEKNKGAI